MSNHLFLLSSFAQSNTVNERFISGLLITAIGVIIVMGVLFILSLIFGFFGSLFTNKDDAKKKLVNEDTSNEDIVIEENINNEVQINNLDLELVAVITAAICAMTNETCDKFIVRNIKKVNSWNANNRMNRIN